MSRDGRTWWNKSSQEGNEESGMLAPLMYPTTLPIAAMFIDNHHYRDVQRLLTDAMLAQMKLWEGEWGEWATSEAPWAPGALGSGPFLGASGRLQRPSPLPLSPRERGSF